MGWTERIWSSTDAGLAEERVEMCYSLYERDQPRAYDGLFDVIPEADIGRDTQTRGTSLAVSSDEHSL